MKREIEKLIREYVAEYPNKKQTQTTWKTPIFGTANAKDERFEKLKISVRPTHVTPRELLENAESVIAYFLPFKESVSKSNINRYTVSEDWAIAYIETNQLIADLNTYIMAHISGNGYEASAIPATHNFDLETLMSDWSHRHIAEIAGVGKFGLNNMLITEQGCAGRVGSIVTSLPLESTKIKEEENCLYLKDGSCGICVRKCPKNVFEDGYDRFKCYELCLENDAYYEELSTTDVCGKCCVGLPCTYKNPCKVI